ncbi:ACP S-malonyltransferase [Streptomyces hygroscopicus]|uniref:ACP S-malonyltransferase n=1 Tax=Streptomyces hygroscopicus TaxID=1912 RepID=UPI00223FB8C3|nr:acyltransferase domain-containing protein [Streptomyces hygroscopicus]
MTVAFLFPGQGAQRPGMLHDLPPGSETYRTLSDAAAFLGRPVGPGDDGADAFDSEGPMRTDTTAIQLALLIAGTAGARELAARGCRPDWVAGHSVGAVTAAVAAGALDLTDALDLVRLRAALMSAAVPTSDEYGMVAIGGLSQAQVERCAAQVRAEGLTVYASNVNAPDQVTVSGSVSGLDRVAALCRERGAKRSNRLGVPIPAHCALLDGVVAPLTDHLADLARAGRLRRPQCAWVTNIDGRPTRDPQRMAADLAQGVARPVRWYDATTGLYERGVTLFTELPPAGPLTALANAAFPHARSYAVGRDLDSAAVLMRRFKLPFGALPLPCSFSPYLHHQEPQ